MKKSEENSIINLVHPILGFVPDSVKRTRASKNQSIKKGDRIKIVDNSLGGSTVGRDYAGQEGIFHGHTNHDSCWVILDSQYISRSGGYRQPLPLQPWLWEIEPLGEETDV